MKRTLIIALILALQTGAALAHTALESATPAKDATVTAPEALTLTFSEAVTLAFTGITLTAADGTAVTTGEATLNADTGTILVAACQQLAIIVHIVLDGQGAGAVYVCFFNTGVF